MCRGNIPCESKPRSLGSRRECSVCLSYGKLIQWQNMAPLPQAGKCHSAGSIVHPNSWLVSSVSE